MAFNSLNMAFESLELASKAYVQPSQTLLASLSLYNNMYMYYIS